jgi:hypothetical protein
VKVLREAAGALFILAVAHFAEAASLLITLVTGMEMYTFASLM